MNFTTFQRCLLSLSTKATVCCELTIAFLQQKRFMNFFTETLRFRAHTDNFRYGSNKFLLVTEKKLS